MEEPYAYIVTFDWQSAVLAYEINDSGFVEVENCLDHTVIKSVEAVGTGRLYLENLPHSTQIDLIFRWANGEKHLSFTTLPAPQGELHGEFALIADPHISIKKENRKGRFFVESAALAEDVVKQCERLGITCTLWPGDITNAGLPEEYSLAAAVLEKLPQKPGLIPGNHDLNADLWAQHFGERRWVRNVPGMGKVIGADTSEGKLLAEDAQVIEQTLSADGRVVIMSHYQFFESPDINHTQPGAVLPSNISEYADLLKKITETPSLIYAGHQNIMSVTQIGKTVQINLPQPPQYPCGWLRVRCFDNGTYYTFEPISSEVLRQWSRRAGNAAAEFYAQRQWREEYRRGGDFPESGNFFMENIRI